MGGGGVKKQISIYISSQKKREVEAYAMIKGLAQSEVYVRGFDLLISKESKEIQKLIKDLGGKK